MKIMVKIAGKLFLIIGCLLPAFTNTTAMQQVTHCGKYGCTINDGIDHSVSSAIFSCNGENVLPCDNPTVVENNEIAQGRILWTVIPAALPQALTHRIPSFNEKYGIKFTPTANYISAKYDRSEYLNGLAGKEIKIIMVSSPGTDADEKGIVTFYRQLPNETSWTEVAKMIISAETPKNLSDIMLKATIEPNGTISFNNLTAGQTAKVFLGKRNFLNKRKE